jgi:hypothetical protein
LIDSETLLVLLYFTFQFVHMSLLGDRFSEMQVVEKTERPKHASARLAGLLGELGSKPVYLYSALILICVAIFTLYRPLEQPVGGDPAIYDYIAQSILRGQVPYRDVVDIKGPGSYYITVASMWLGGLFGIRDVLADRLAHGLMLAALVVVVFKVAAEYLGSKAGGVIAAIFILMSSAFVGWMALGAQPKLSMILFGMLALLMVKRDRPVWAGVFAMLSCLCWQPGLLFAGTAFLVMSGYMTRWRDGRAMKVVLGAAAPLAVAVAYLAYLGALRYFWAYAFEYNYGVFGPSAAKPLTEAVAHFFKVSNRVLGPLIFGFAASAVGWVIFVVEAIRRKLASEGLGPPDSLKDAIAIPPLVYLIFCFVNFQGGPDLVLFFPFAGIFSAFFVLETMRLIRLKIRSPQYQLAAKLIPAVAIVLMLAAAFEQGVVAWRSGKGFFKRQDHAIKSIGEALGPDGKIYVHGSVEILVFLNRPNLNPYVFVDWGMDDFIANKWYGGSFQNVVDEMDRQAPRLVSLTRLGRVNHGEDLMRWASERYKNSSIGGYDLFERKP